MSLQFLSLGEPARRDAFLAGMRTMSAAAAAVLIWGLVTGATMAKSSLSMAQCIGMSLLVYGGSAQLASLPLLASHAPLPLIALAALIINLRFLIFSAAIRPHVMHLPRARRMFYGYWIADFTFIFFMNRANQEPFERREDFLLGLGVMNLLCWQVGSIVGIVAASVVPSSWGLELAGTLALLALIVPQCASLPGLAGVLAAALVGVAAHGLPLRLGLLLAMGAGIACAVWIESRQAAKR